MKEKKVIIWKIPCVDRNKAQWEYVDAEDNETGRHKEKMLVKKRFDRILYLCSSDLSPEDNVYVDIALQYKSIFGKYDFFVILRDLFQEGDWTQIQGATYWETITIPEYFEDESGQVLNREQFMEVVFDLPPQMRTKSGIHVPADLSEKIAKDEGIAELVPPRQEDFNLTEEKYKQLNLFVQTCLEFENTPFCRECQTFHLKRVFEKWEFQSRITENQIKASLMEFRKLYNINEPASFIKAVSILSDSRFQNVA